MPRPHRALGASEGSVEGLPGSDLTAEAVTVLTSPHLDEVVDLVAYAADDSIIAANASGSSRFGLRAPYEVLSASGRDPLAHDDPLAFTPLADEPAAPPASSANAYPFGRERLASLFADPRAPDVVVVHTAGHYWP